MITRSGSFERHLYDGSSAPVNPRDHSTGPRALAPENAFGPSGFSTLGQSSPDPLAHLRAAAKAAIDEGNGELARQLLGVIEREEQQRASAQAPVQLEVVRAKREGGK